MKIKIIFFLLWPLLSSCGKEAEEKVEGKKPKVRSEIEMPEIKSFPEDGFNYLNGVYKLINFTTNINYNAGLKRNSFFLFQPNGAWYECYIREDKNIMKFNYGKYKIKGTDFFKIEGGEEKKLLYEILKDSKFEITEKIDEEEKEEFTLELGPSEVSNSLNFVDKYKKDCLDFKYKVYESHRSDFLNQFEALPCKNNWSQSRDRVKIYSKKISAADVLEENLKRYLILKTSLFKDGELEGRISKSYLSGFSGNDQSSISYFTENGSLFIIDKISDENFNFKGFNLKAIICPPALTDYYSESSFRKDLILDDDNYPFKFKVLGNEFRLYDKSECLAGYVVGNLSGEGYSKASPDEDPLLFKKTYPLYQRACEMGIESE
jgi:hypothetical protein